MDSSNFLPTRAGTTGGLLINVLLQISGSEMIKTVVVTATGAAVSFLVSFLLQRLLKRRKP
ncbi:MAG: hypothetical protein EOO14_20630 [Chitinophagaceae bacterium]|nr:MAG: hypothetical protein EOO14_20630 [Chitinophagaceae bacterium]